MKYFLLRHKNNIFDQQVKIGTENQNKLHNMSEKVEQLTISIFNSKSKPSAYVHYMGTILTHKYVLNNKVKQVAPPIL